MRSLILLVSLALHCCQPQTIICSMDANIVPTGDTTGVSSTRALVNFTNLTSGSDEGGVNTNLTFTNSGGDVLTFTLEGGLGIKQYDFGAGSINSFSSIVNITSDGVIVPVSLTTDFGFLVVTNYQVDAGNLLTTLQGSFHVNLTGGGAASGNISYSAAAE